MVITWPDLLRVKLDGVGTMCAGMIVSVARSAGVCCHPLAKESAIKID